MSFTHHFPNQQKTPKTWEVANWNFPIHGRLRSQSYSSFAEPIKMPKTHAHQGFQRFWGWFPFYSIRKDTVEVDHPSGKHRRKDGERMGKRDLPSASAVEIWKKLLLILVLYRRCGSLYFIQRNGQTPESRLTQRRSKHYGNKIWMLLTVHHRVSCWQNAR